MSDRDAVEWAASGPPDVPLVFDFDGTVSLVDTLKWLRRCSAQAGGDYENRRAAALAAGKQHEKLLLWSQGWISPTDIPYDPILIEAARQARARGRVTALATGSSHQLAEGVAEHLGVFDVTMGSTPEVNATGARKAALLESRFGRGQFDYIGDSDADIPVWMVARAGLYVSRVGGPTVRPPENTVTHFSTNGMREAPQA